MRKNISLILKESLEIVSNGSLMLSRGKSDSVDFNDEEIATLVFNTNLLSLSLLEKRVFECDIIRNKNGLLLVERESDKKQELPSSTALFFAVENWYNLLQEKDFSMKNKVQELREYSNLFEYGSPIPDVSVASSLRLLNTIKFSQEMGEHKPKPSFVQKGVYHGN